MDPTDCTAFPCLIFDDEFDYLDHEVWEHEITMAGGGVSYRRHDIRNQLSVANVNKYLSEAM